MKQLRVFWVLCLVFVGISVKIQAQTFSEILPYFSADSIGRTIRDLEAFGNRYCDEGDGNRDVAEYIVRRLQNYGVENAVVDSFYLNLNTGWLPVISRYCYNVKGTILGSQVPDSVVVIGAHLDAISLENWTLQAQAPGADDNASGVAVMLEIARIINQFDLTPRYSICFVGFDAEEVGLRGAGYDVEQRYQNDEKIVAMLNNDMVANQPEDMPYMLTLHWYDNATDLADLASSICEHFTSITAHIPQAEDNLLRQNSDSWAYAQYGYRAIFAIEYYFSDYYHTVNDVLEHCNLDFAKEVAKMNFGMLYSMVFGDIWNAQTSIENIQPEVQIYPNPTANMVYVRNQSGQAKMQVSFYDMLGRSIVKLNTTENVISFNMSDLDCGVYFAEILVDGRKITRKIIKK